MRVSSSIVVALVVTSLASPVGAQEEPTATPNARQQELIDEVVVRGRRTLLTLRMELEAARENVWAVFNDVNSSDDFDITCLDAARTGTRITKRVCRPQYANDATRRAGQTLARLMRGYSDDDREAALSRANSEAAAEIGWTSVMDKRLDTEFQQLAGEQPELATAILDYFAKQRQYDAAIRTLKDADESRASIQAAVSIVDTFAVLQSERVPRRSSVVAPRPVYLTLPEARPSREGWVKLRYSVGADGRTADVRAVDVITPGLDAASAVAAAEAWQFEPAAENGMPIDWHNNVAVVSFRRASGAYEGSLAFADAYAAVAELIADGRLEEAQAANERMQRLNAETLEELQLSQLQLAAIEHALGRRHAALAAIRRATEQGVVGLAEDELKIALEHRFALELELGYAADALRTYERRDKLERLPARESLAQQALVLEQALTGADASQAVQVRIDGSGQWEHPLSWNAFEVSEANGAAESLGIECHRNKAQLPFRSNMQTTIPVSWGGCVLTIRGQPETTLTLYEFP